MYNIRVCRLSSLLLGFWNAILLRFQGVVLLYSVEFMPTVPAFVPVSSQQNPSLCCKLANYAQRRRIHADPYNELSAHMKFLYLISAVAAVVSSKSVAQWSRTSLRVVKTPPSSSMELGLAVSGRQMHSTLEGLPDQSRREVTFQVVDARLCHPTEIDWPGRSPE